MKKPRNKNKQKARDIEYNNENRKKQRKKVSHNN